jgi:hypothetical protein
VITAFGIALIVIGLGIMLVLIAIGLAQQLNGTVRHQRFQHRAVTVALHDAKSRLAVAQIKTEMRATSAVLRRQLESELRDMSSECNG